MKSASIPTRRRIRDGYWAHEVGEPPHWQTKQQTRDEHYERLAELGLLSTDPLPFGQKLLRAIDCMEVAFAFFIVCGACSFILGAMYASKPLPIFLSVVFAPILFFLGIVVFKDQIFDMFGWKIKYTRGELEEQARDNSANGTC